MIKYQTDLSWWENDPLHRQLTKSKPLLSQRTYQQLLNQKFEPQKLIMSKEIWDLFSKEYIDKDDKIIKEAVQETNKDSEKDEEPMSFVNVNKAKLKKFISDDTADKDFIPTGPFVVGTSIIDYGTEDVIIENQYTYTKKIPYDEIVCSEPHIAQSPTPFDNSWYKNNFTTAKYAGGTGYGGVDIAQALNSISKFPDEIELPKVTKPYPPLKMDEIKYSIYTEKLNKFPIGVDTYTGDIIYQNAKSVQMPIYEIGSDKPINVDSLSSKPSIKQTSKWLVDRNIKGRALLKELIEKAIHPSIRILKIYKYKDRETSDSKQISVELIDNDEFLNVLPGEELAIDCFAQDDTSTEVFIPFVDLSISAEEAIQNRNYYLLTEGTGLDVAPLIYNSGNAAHAYLPIKLPKEKASTFYGNLMLSTVDPKTNQSILDLRWVAWFMSKGSNGLRISANNTKPGTIIPKRKVQFEL